MTSGNHPPSSGSVHAAHLGFAVPSDTAGRVADGLPTGQGA
jgi:hypothetical protein